MKYFDDEFWSEDASIEKLIHIHSGHKLVFEAMDRFLSVPNKSITYIIGNHDAEIALPGVRQKFLSYFEPDNTKKIKIIHDEDTYNPAPGVYFQHGHQYEKAHVFNPKETVIQSTEGKRYLKPTWGSYYCHHVLNKYKPERIYINQIMPIKKYLTHGLLYDSFFTLRFIFATVYFFVMIRFWYFYITKFKLHVIVDDVKEELALFKNYESLTRSFFQKNDDARCLLTGHTHHASYRIFHDGTTFINTGTWTRVINIDFSFNLNGHYLTFALLEFEDENYELKDFQRNVRSSLLEWRGDAGLPYKDFTI